MSDPAWRIAGMGPGAGVRMTRAFRRDHTPCPLAGAEAVAG